MSRFQLSKRLLSITRRVLAPLALSIAARVVFLLLGVGLFALGGWAVLAVPTGRSAWGAGAVIAALVVMSLLKGLARYGEQFAGHFVAFHSLAMLRNYFYDRLEPQAPAGSDSLDPGDLLNRVTKDIDRIEVFFAHTLAPVCTAVVVPAITLGWMGAATSWWLALVELCFLLVSGLVVPVLGAGESRAAARELRVARGRLAAHVTDSVQGVREVLAFGAQGRRMEQMGAHEAAIASSTAVSTGWIARRRGLNQAVLGLSVLAVALVGLSMVPSGALAPDQVGLAVGIALGSFGPVLAVEDFAADLDQAFASAERVFAVTDRAPLVADPAEPVGFDAAGDIAFTGVSFTYPQVRLDADGAPGARPEVLHDVTIRIPAGRTTAIVGASGSGKSTLAALLTRTWDPDSGSVSIGEVDIRSVGLRPLREAVASAPQRPYIFNDTVRANLLLANPGASPAQLDEALERVDLASWAASEPDGLDTNVGDMGERLSGGQRQRLALARALLRDASVYVLDEATSQVDPGTEASMLAGIREATRGRTVVVIAHRVSTVADADQIVVMDSGRVVETGAYGELMARGGALAALVAREATVA